MKCRPVGHFEETFTYHTGPISTESKIKSSDMRNVKKFNAKVFSKDTDTDLVKTPTQISKKNILTSK